MVDRTVVRRAAWAAVLGLSLGLVAGCSAGPTSAPARSTSLGNAGQPYVPGGDGPPTGRAVTGQPAREVDPAAQPVSTFAMDVDTASYGYTQRTLADGRPPGPSTVRPEEFVNALPQNYPQPDGNGFTVQADGARLPASHRSTPDTRLLRIGLQTRGESPATRPDAALTFVVDVSGSMGAPGKLDLVKDALKTLVGQLRPTDSVALVAYDDTARTLREMTPVRDRSALRAAIDELRVGGSTDLEAGLVRGYDLARAGFRAGASNRVVLLSDGLANVGDTDAAPILAKVRDAAAKQISLLGVGVGSDYGDALMEQLADRGDGFVVYVSSQDQARQVFVDQLPAALSVRALDAKVQVTFDPATVAGYRLIGYDDRVLNSSDFRNDHVDGGEVGPGHAVTALYAVRLREGAAGRVAQAQVRWLDPTTREASETSSTVDVPAVGGAFESAAPSLRLSYAAAYTAEVLRGSAYGGEVRLADLATIAQRAGDSKAGADLATLIHQAERLH